MASCHLARRESPPSGGNDGVDVQIQPHQTRVGSGRPGTVNLTAVGWLGVRVQREAGISLFAPARRARTILLAGLLVTAVSAVLEFANPGNYWLLFEDISSAVAPGAGALAVAIAASRSTPEHRGYRWVLAIALGITACGQPVADIPDVFPGTSGPLLRVVSEGCNVIGAIVSIAALWRILYGRLEGEARRQACLDGLIIMAASVMPAAAGTAARAGRPRRLAAATPVVVAAAPLPRRQGHASRARG